MLNNYESFEHVLHKPIAIWIRFEKAAKLSHTMGILRPLASTLPIILRRSSSHVSSGQDIPIPDHETARYATLVIPSYEVSR